MDDDAISLAAEAAKAGKPGLFGQSDWWNNEAVQICMKVKDYCFPQAIGTYVSLSRGLHQLGSSFLPPFLPILTKHSVVCCSRLSLSSLFQPQSQAHQPSPFHTQEWERRGLWSFGRLIVWLSHCRTAGGSVHVREGQRTCSVCV